MNIFHLVLLLLSYLYSCLSLLLEDRFFESIPEALQLYGVFSQFRRSFIHGNFVICCTATLQLFNLLVWPLGSAIALRSLFALRGLLALWTSQYFLTR